MRRMQHRTRARIVASIILSLLASPVGPLLQAQVRTAKAATTPAAAPVEESWPRAFAAASGAALVVYQPQVARTTLDATAKNIRVVVEDTGHRPVAL